MQSDFEPEPEPQTFSESFLRVACPYARVISLLFSMLLVFTLVSLVSVVALSPPNESWYIALMTAVLDGILVVLLGILLYYCRQFNLQTV